MFTPENYTDMQPGMIVKDRQLGCSWKVLSNDGTNIELQNILAVSDGVKMTVNKNNSTFTFFEAFIKEYNVSIAVDGRIDVTVFAKNVSEAFEKAKKAFLSANLSKMEVIGSAPVHLESADGTVEADY